MNIGGALIGLVGYGAQDYYYDRDRPQQPLIRWPIVTKWNKLRNPPSTCAICNSRFYPTDHTVPAVCCLTPIHVHCDLPHDYRCTKCDRPARVQRAQQQRDHELAVSREQQLDLLARSYRLMGLVTPFPLPAWKSLDYRYRAMKYRNTNTQCPICLEEFKNKDRILKLPCKHLYHQRCDHPTVVRCPLCRGS
jgi:hypothetical protein